MIYKQSILINKHTMYCDTVQGMMQHTNNHIQHKFPYTIHDTTYLISLHTQNKSNNKALHWWGMESGKKGIGRGYHIPKALLKDTQRRERYVFTDIGTFQDEIVSEHTEDHPAAVQDGHALLS